MVKTEQITVWVVTLPNGKKVEIESAVADRYFRNGSATTPFSHLHVEPVVKTVRVKVPPQRKPRPPKKTGRGSKAVRPRSRARRRASARTPARKSRVSSRSRK